MSEAPTEQIPGVYHRRIGDIVVTSISDGYLDGNLDVLKNIDQEEGRRMLADVFRPARRTSVNTFLIHSKGRKAIVDTGCGTYMAPTGGWQLRNLKAAGVDPAEIDTILLTHMHPDHSCGLADKQTKERLFPNAELVCHEKEPAHWQDDAAMAKGTEREQAMFFGAAREQMAPYKDRMRLFTGGEVFPGVTAIPRPGHTPGHTTYLINSGDDSLLIWGDTVHVPELQVPRPEVAIAFDTDSDMAIESRRKTLDMAASERLLITGMHTHFPGFSNIARRGDSYAIIPEAWQHAL